MADSRLRALAAERRAALVPGVYSALTARQAELAGFEAIYATGAGIANSLLAVPDLGLTSFKEVLDQVQYLVDAVEVPAHRLGVVEVGLCRLLRPGRAARKHRQCDRDQNRRNAAPAVPCQAFNSSFAVACSPVSAPRHCPAVTASSDSQRSSSAGSTA